MNIPVDGIVIEASYINTNESSMTGNCDEFRKETLDLCLYR
jgi:hypothetical protein